MTIRHDVALVLDAEDARVVAAALKIAARAALKDGIDYRHRGRYDRFARILAMAEAAAAGSGTGTGCDPDGPPVASSEWLSTSEAASLLGVGARAVLARIARGELPAFRVGARWLIRRQDVWLAARDWRQDARVVADAVVGAGPERRAAGVVHRSPG